MKSNNFPQALRARAQWMVAGTGEPFDATGKQNPEYKRPIDPKTGRWGSPTDPSTWGTFEQAMASPLPLKGFVFTDEDPFAVIDLDTYKAKNDMVLDLHEAIMEAASTTYSEWSQSGAGTHIIGLGVVPTGANNELNCLEVYSGKRFMICTGDVKNEKPLADIQALLDYIYPLLKNEGSLGPINWKELGDGDPATMSDAAVIEMASNADNGEKFDRLCRGDMTDYDGNWSVADSALIEFLCFYTPDNQQVTRLFLMSKLAEREKAYRPDYIPRTIMRMRQRITNDQPPPVDPTAIMQRAQAVALPPPPPPSVNTAPTGGNPPPPPPPGVNTAGTEQSVPPPPSLGSKGDSAATTFPPGLIGELAEYVYGASIRPVREIALATAITVLAGIVGRNFNVSRTGLNQYVLLLAKTGSGKESVQSSIDRLFGQVSKITPQADQFIGPAHFSSGPALVKTFQDKPCFVSVLGEFGHRLKAMTDPRANGAETTLLAAFLDIYGKSGWGQMLRSSVYSEKEKNTTVVHAPSLTILGETEPDGFFSALDERAVTSGFLPRFTVIEYTGDRPRRNRNAWTSPPEALVQKMASLIQTILAMSTNHACTDVAISADALALLDRFDEFADNQINEGSSTDRYLWNRAHLKAIRMAALVAVGVNSNKPTITAGEAAWAIELVKQDIDTIQARYRKGDVGSGDSKLQADLVGVVKKYLSTGAPRFSDYHRKGCIPHRLLMQATASRAAFKTHKLGATRALKDTLAGMVEAGMLVQLPKQQAREWFKTSASVYAVGEQWDE